MEVTEQILNAKLEAVEARTESKFAQFMGELKVISTTLSTLVDDVKDIKVDMKSVRTDVGTLKTDVAVLKVSKAGKGFIVSALAIGASLTVAAMTILSKLGYLAAS
ncbi:hypothetical protein TomTYG75_06880 [Sphingobium sp. TomTYG75]